jgi:hypothetical protein
LTWAKDARFYFEDREDDDFSGPPIKQLEARYFRTIDTKKVNGSWRIKYVKLTRLRSDITNGTTAATP